MLRLKLRVLPEKCEKSPSFRTDQELHNFSLTVGIPFHCKRSCSGSSSICIYIWLFFPATCCTFYVSEIIHLLPPPGPGLISELVCLPSLFSTKIFSQTPPSLPSDFLLSVFSLNLRFTSYCEYRISSFNIFVVT